MRSDVAVRSRPSTSDSTTAGAEMIAPQDIPRDTRNSRLVKAARLRIEPVLEELVGRVDARAVEERHERQRQDDHRDRQRKVELDEAQAVGVALSRRADHRDGAQLRRHHRDAGRPPGNRSFREEIALDLVAVLRPLQAVVDDPGREGQEDRPVDGVHSAALRRLGEELREGVERREREDPDDEDLM